MQNGKWDKDGWINRNRQTQITTFDSLILNITQITVDHFKPVQVTNWNPLDITIVTLILQLTRIIGTEILSLFKLHINYGSAKTTRIRFID